jgi:plastocyanin
MFFAVGISIFIQRTLTKEILKHNNNMKKILFTLCFIALIASNSFATVRTINVQSNSFTPALTNAFVGDTIKFQWLNGFHTTTCNGTNGTTRPAGAAAWNSDMSSSTPTFMYVITVAGNYHYVCLPHAPGMAGDINATVSNVQELNSIADAFSLAQNYPNPFNPTTKINFSIPKSGYVSLKVYDILGNEVSDLVNQNLTTGTYTVDFNAAANGVAISSGVYFYRLQAADFTAVRKMYLVK